MYKSISYLSVPTRTLSLEDRESIYNKAKVSNRKLDITGILYKTDENFFQILEGESEIIDEIFSKIKKDSRHHHIQKLLEINIAHKIFDTFTTGSEILEGANTLYGIQEYFSSLEYNALEHSEIFSNIIGKLLMEQA